MNEALKVFLIIGFIFAISYVLFVIAEMIFSKIKGKSYHQEVINLSAFLIFFSIVIGFGSLLFWNPVHKELLKIIIGLSISTTWTCGALVFLDGEHKEPIDKLETKTETKTEEVKEVKMFKVGDRVKVIVCHAFGTASVGEKGTVISKTTWMSDITKKKYSLDKEFYKLELIKGGKMVENLKQYFEKNQDTFITIAIVILIDNYFFDGTLRNRIKDLVEKMLGKAETQLLETKGSK